MKVVTRVLNPDELKSELALILDDVEALHSCSLKVMYGWDCDLSLQDIWKEALINSTELRSYIRQSQEAGIFELGTSDLIVRDEKDSFELKLCHEADIHLEGESEFVQATQKRWESKNLLHPK